MEGGMQAKVHLPKFIWSVFLLGLWLRRNMGLFISKINKNFLILRNGISLEWLTKESGWARPSGQPAGGTPTLLPRQRATGTAEERRNRTTRTLWTPKEKASSQVETETHQIPQWSTLIDFHDNHHSLFFVLWWPQVTAHPPRLWWPVLRYYHILHGLLYYWNLLRLPSVWWLFPLVFLLAGYYLHPIDDSWYWMVVERNHRAIKRRRCGKCRSVSQN